MILFDAIREVLKEKNWSHFIDPKNHRIDMDVLGENAGWKMNIFVIPESYSALFYSYYPLKCDNELIDKMGVFLHKINLGLVAGNFEFDTNERRIRFKTYVDFSRSEIVYSQIEVALEKNIAISDKYFLAITKFFSGDQSIDEILKEIEST